MKNKHYLIDQFNQRHMKLINNRDVDHNTNSNNRYEENFTTELNYDNNDLYKNNEVYYVNNNSKTGSSKINHYNNINVNEYIDKNQSNNYNNNNYYDNYPKHYDNNNLAISPNEHIKIKNEYSEYSSKSDHITNNNIKNTIDNDYAIISNQQQSDEVDIKKTEKSLPILSILNKDNITNSSNDYYTKNNSNIKRELGQMYLKQLELTKTNKKLEKQKIIEEDRERLRLIKAREEKEDELRSKLEYLKKEHLVNDLKSVINKNAKENKDYYNYILEEKKKSFNKAVIPVNHNRISYDKLLNSNNEKYGNNSSNNVLSNSTNLTGMFNKRSNLNTTEDDYAKKHSQQMLYRNLLDKQMENNNKWAKNYLNNYGWNNELHSIDYYNNSIKNNNVSNNTYTNNTGSTNNVLAHSTRLKNYSDWEKLYFNNNINVKPCKYYNIKILLYCSYPLFLLL